jgi:HAD superfamily hydrolase (TIGR01484 family)
MPLQDHQDTAALSQRLDKQSSRGRAALFTDIDNTFIQTGKEASTQTLIQALEKRGWPIVALTGDSQQSVTDRIIKGELPWFEAIAAAVGTEIWLLQESSDGPKYVLDKDFESWVSAKSFDHSALVAAAHNLVLTLKTTHPGWEFDFQGPEALRQRFKISFYFFARYADLPTVRKVVTSTFAKQKILICEEINFNQTLSPAAEMKKYCLDVLPTSKSEAVQYLCETYDITRGIVAGDSGNDVDMLLESGDLKAVLVGGHQASVPEMLEGSSPEHTVFIESDPTRSGAQSILYILETEFRD